MMSTTKKMKSVLVGSFLVGINLLMAGCNPQRPAESTETVSVQRNEVIETIRSRRSIRQYQDRAVNRDTMQLILDCGILAPNGMNKQSWEVRVLDNPDLSAVSQKCTRRLIPVWRKIRNSETCFVMPLRWRLSLMTQVMTVRR